MERKEGKRSVAAVSTTVVLIAVLIIAVVAGVLIYYFVIPREKTIKIGLVAPMTRPEGEDMKRAAELAVEEINEAGGIYVEDWGRNASIEIVLADTQYLPDVGVTAVRRAIIEDKVDLLIGGFSSGVTLADQVEAIENRVPFIITGASTHLVTRRGFLPDGHSLKIDDPEGMSYMFHYCTTTFHYTRTVVCFLNESVRPMVCPDRNLRLAVLWRNDAYGGGVLADTDTHIKAENLPIDIVINVSYTVGNEDFVTELQTIKAAKPDALFAVDFTTYSALIYTQGQKDVGLDTLYIAVECCEEPDFYTLLKKWGDRQLLESKFQPYFGEPFYLPLMDHYVPAYEAKYGVTPGMMGADTYDAFYIAKDAIERAGTVDKEAVKDALEATNMEQMLIMTETGRIEFSSENDTYHEIAPVTFMQQLFWDEAKGECRPAIVWPDTAPIVGTIKQRDFELPENYEPGEG